VAAVNSDGYRGGRGGGDGRTSGGRRRGWVTRWWGALPQPWATDGQGQRGTTPEDEIIGGGRGGRQKEIIKRRTPPQEGITHSPIARQVGPSSKSKVIVPIWCHVISSCSWFNPCASRSKFLCRYTFARVL
jgi:hypothetical protein